MEVLAFLTVCLAVLQKEPEVKAELEAIIANFLSTTGWKPAISKPIAGALPFTRYNWAMRRIAAKAGTQTDVSLDHEYTDWDELRRFAGEFLGLIRQAPAPRVF